MPKPTTPAKPRRGRPPLNLSAADKLARRRASTARAVAKLRAGKKAAGVVVVQIELTAEEFAELRARRKENRYCPATFDKRALILGAKFCANMAQGTRPAARKRGTGGVVVEL